VTHLPIIPKRAQDVQRVPKKQFMALAAASPKLATWVRFCVGSHVAAKQRTDFADRKNQRLLAALPATFHRTDAEEAWPRLDKKAVSNMLTWMALRGWVTRIGNNRSGHWEVTRTSASNCL
jgi:hypothetical protein